VRHGKLDEVLACRRMVAAAWQVFCRPCSISTTGCKTSSASRRQPMMVETQIPQMVPAQASGAWCAPQTGCVTPPRCAWTG
jgi:hypothetical protein